MEETLSPVLCANPFCDTLVNPFLYFGNEGPVYKDMPGVEHCFGCRLAIEYREENGLS